ncbi:uncharacterized protein LOC136038279 isoform X3 [Artemia franciscana]|uniref:uncharacterized protein LOC136038279 isoform X3 n=1 Tax=Artemia franciscana TaxID=6661 RepID=UPI0032DB9390
MKDDAMLNVVEELGKKEMLRDIHGFYEALTKEMEQMDSELFFQTYRMDKEKLDSILTLIKADIQKQDTVMRPSILAKARLAVTLRLFKEGRSLLYEERVPSMSRVVVLNPW